MTTQRLYTLWLPLKMENKVFLGDEKAKERQCIGKPPARMQPHQYSDLNLLRQILGSWELILMKKLAVG